MSTVIEFANDAGKPMTAREALFAIQRMRRLASRVTFQPGDEDDFHRLLDEEETRLAQQL